MSKWNVIYWDTQLKDNKSINVKLIDKLEYDGNYKFYFTDESGIQDVRYTTRIDFIDLLELMEELNNG